jgi:hypothetical protein
MGNPAVGIHEGPIAKLADEAITDRNLLGKFGSDVDHVALCGAAELPLGVIEDEAAAAEDPVAVALLGCTGRTVRMVASEAIDYGEEVFTAASGKVQDPPTVAGTYYRVGRAIQAATTDGDEIEVIPYTPTAYVVSE